MKKIISIFLALVMCVSLCAGLPFSASALTYGDFEYRLKADDTAEITGYTGSDTIVKIPRTIRKDSAQITVTSIGEAAFIYAMDIISLTIPGSVTEIGENAFNSCFGLEELIFSESGIKTIRSQAFMNCSLLSVSLPESIETIEDGAFNACNDLRSFTVAESNNYYTAVDGVLYNKDMTELVKFPSMKSTEFVIPSTVTTLRTDSIASCGKIQRLVIPTSVTAIEQEAICYNDKLTEILYLSTEEDFNANVTVGTGNDLSKLVYHSEHDWQVTENVPATASKPGYIKSVCSVCQQEKTETLEPTGVIITVTPSSLGSVLIDGEELEEYAKHYSYGANYTLEAKPSDNARFVGWIIKGRLVSENEVFKNVAYTNLTIEPLFEEKTEQFTITFFNKYGDVLGEWKNVKGDIPTARNIAGYNFRAWTLNGKDISEEEINALTKSANIWADYDKAVTGYTITAQGATITVKSTTYENTATDIPYDTRAKVYIENATAWKAGDAIVAYGDTYEFYVGSDIELTPIYEAVEQKASVTILGAEKLANTEKSYNVLATRSLPEDITWNEHLKDRGFIYGVASRFENLGITTKEDIDIDTIKTLDSNIIVKHGTPTASDQFAITMPVTAGKTITAFAFITIQKDGKTEVVYSDPITFTAK